MDREGVEYKMTIHLLVSNIAITKQATVRRLGDKVAIVIPCDTDVLADQLITSLGSVVQG